MVAARSLQIGMLAEKVRDLGLDRLGQLSTRPIAQDFGELIVDVSWLNQLDDVIFGHGISLLRWRSGGVKHPHDMPPSRFPPSPTFSDSSANLGPPRQRRRRSRRTGQPVRNAGYWFFKSDFIFSSTSSNDTAPFSLSPLMKKVGVASTFRPS